jgi:hypothetical protein
MPPIPPGGWTRENLRIHWRRKIVNSPNDAPLSHTELAEFLRTRDSFGSWFWWKERMVVWDEQPGPDASFETRVLVIPALVSVLIFLLAWPIFHFFPFILGIYPMAFMSEDTLCSLGRLFSRQGIIRCDPIVAAMDLSLLSSLLALGVLTLLFLRQGGIVVLTDDQRTKRYIHHGHNGNLGYPLIGRLFSVVASIWIMTYFVFDQDLFHYIFILPLLIVPVSGSAYYLLHLGHTIKAAYVIIFFHKTGRFPSWLEDLSP